MDVYLGGKNLRGIVDEVLFLNDGTAAPLDYKFAIYNERIFKTYRIQMHCYALLIERNFSVDVKKAYLVFTRSKNKLVELPITERDTSKIAELTDKIVEIISGNIFPPSTKSKSKCLTCSYRNICVK